MSDRKRMRGGLLQGPTFQGQRKAVLSLKSMFSAANAGIAVLLLLVGAFFFQQIQLRSNRGIEVQRPHGSRRLVELSLQHLTVRGVEISDSVRRLAEALVGVYEKRPDLRAQFTSNGLPDLIALGRWAETYPDASSEGLVEVLPATAELEGRLGIMRDQKILPVLYWSLKNEPSLEGNFTSVLWHLSELWRNTSNAELRFARDGKVDVLAFLKFANSLPIDSPGYRASKFDAFVVREAIHELSR